MKKWLTAIWLLGLTVVVFLARPQQAVMAQVPGTSIGFNSTATAAGCPTPTFTNSNIQAYVCAAPDGVYISTVQAPTPVKLLTTAPTAPVSSVFGRTGAVAAQSGDYSYSQLASPPTTINCSTASLSSGSTGTFSASSCTIR